ncbi:retroviral-like aspartic protease family protein [Candidatus Latescibacterota bacterium]
MKRTGHRLLVIGFILLCSGCSAGRIMIAEHCELNGIKESISYDEITLSAIKDMYYRGQYSLAENMLESFEPIAEERAEYYLYRGIINKHQNRFHAALEMFNKSIDILDKSPVDSLLIKAYRGKVNVYHDLHDYKTAALYLGKCEELGGKVSPYSIAYLENFEGKPYEIVQGVSKTTLKANYKSGRLIPKVQINGSKETGLAIDTGANISLLLPGYAKKYKIRRLTHKGKMSTQIRVYSVNTGVIDSLRLGDIVIRNVPVLIPDSKLLRINLFLQNLFFPWKRIKGVIGLPVLKNFDVTIDFRNDKIELSLPGKRKEPEKYHGDFYLIDGLIQYPVYINCKAKANLLLDTGDYRRYIKTSKRGFESLEKKDVKTTWGLKTHPLFMLLPEKRIKRANVTMGNYLLKNVEIRKKKPLRLPASMDGIIGNGILENFKISIDFINMRLDLEPYEKSRTITE